LVDAVADFWAAIAGVARIAIAATELINFFIEYSSSPAFMHR
jgi:hypothetical protein